MDENQNKDGQLNIELDQEVAEGTYSNLAIINHSMSELIVDFINIMPGVPKAKVKSRLTKALADNVRKFEKQHGEIKDYEQPPIPMNFGPTGQA